LLRDASTTSVKLRKPEKYGGGKVSTTRLCSKVGQRPILHDAVAPTCDESDAGNVTVSPLLRGRGRNPEKLRLHKEQHVGSVVNLHCVSAACIDNLPDRIREYQDSPPSSTPSGRRGTVEARLKHDGMRKLSSRGASISVSGRQKKRSVRR